MDSQQSIDASSDDESYEIVDASEDEAFVLSPPLLPSPDAQESRRHLLEAQEMAEKMLLLALNDFDGEGELDVTDIILPPVAAAPARPSQRGQAVGPDNVSVTSMHFPERVVRETAGHFGVLYGRCGRSEESLVAEFLTDIKAFTLSDYFNDRQRAKCMLKMFFDEFPFINEYPTPELQITAAIFGGIIREGLIESPDAEEAVRMIVTSLEKKVDSQQWWFGVVALDECKEKLCADHEVCVMIAGLANFHCLPDSLKAAVQAGLGGQLPVQVAPKPAAVAAETAQLKEITLLKKLLADITIEKEILEVELKNEREANKTRSDKNELLVLRVMTQDAQLRSKTSEINRLKARIAEMNKK